VICSCWTDLACTAWRTDFNEKLCICLAEIFPLTWNIILVINSFDRTHWLARTTIDALIRLDIQHSSAFVNAIHRAFFDAGLVLHIDARFSDHIGHELPPNNLSQWVSPNCNYNFGHSAIFPNSVYPALMATELETAFAALTGKRVSIRLHDPEGGFRDILGFLETPTSLRNRHGDLVEFAHDQIFVWREVIERT
jgi:hypothetical protein